MAAEPARRRLAAGGEGSGGKALEGGETGDCASVVAGGAPVAAGGVAAGGVAGAGVAGWRCCGGRWVGDGAGVVATGGGAGLGAGGGVGNGWKRGMGR